jgi:hypothetical protein
VIPDPVNCTANKHRWHHRLASIDLPGRISVILHEKFPGKNSESYSMPNLMKSVVLAAALLLMAFSFGSCSTQTPSQQAQSAAGGIWSAQLVGGTGSASGFSFTTQFTLGVDGDLTNTYFQFLTTGQNNCFPVNGELPTGQMILNVNQSTFQVTGTFTYKIQASGNTLSLSGDVSGTAATASTLTAGSITGTWSITGGSGCNKSGGTFIMTQATTSTSSSSSSGST